MARTDERNSTNPVSVSVTTLHMTVAESVGLTASMMVAVSLTASLPHSTSCSS